MIYLFLFLLLTLTASVAAREFPYTAAVAESETIVRSGPGTDFYPTVKLVLGDKVEVFHEDGDWCAVRPPLGSFSWISAKYVDLVSGNVGSVNAEGLASRIGSDSSVHDGKLCDTVQVKLKKGERVFVLDKVETPENTASPLWYKINPPRGEFRWVQKKNLFVETPRAENDRPREIQQVVYQNEEAPKIPLPRLPAAANTIPNTSAKAAVPLPSGELFTEFQKVFAELHTEAVECLTRPTEDWVFQELIARADELYTIAPTDDDLEKTYQLLESLKRTQRVRQEIAIKRHFKTSGGVSPSIPQNIASNSGAPAPARLAAISDTTALAALAPQPARATEIARVASNPYAPRADVPASVTKKPTENTPVRAMFNVRGKLGTFDPLPKGHPPYAVVNEKNEIICLVTPAEGLDIKPLLGKQVSINGEVGFYKKANKPDRRHITALEVSGL
jgi:uncharacterized protein YgiM (DUF1202 family)